VKDTPKEERPTTVPARAKQAGDIPTRWAWVEPTVWTTRMLAALETGVKGGRWFSLMDKVYAPANLAAAWKRVRSNRGAAGVDRQSVERFERHAPKYLDELHRELREGRYRPSAVRRQWIPKLGTAQGRPLGIPTVRDRIVQSALRHVLEPIWEVRFADQSYGFRPGRSCKDALRRVDELLRAGFTWIVEADIQSYYDNIDKGRLLAEVAKEVADGKVLQLVEALLEQPVMEEASKWTPEAGIPQGSSIGPLLANVYLHPVDDAIVRAGFELTRYADDQVILCRTEREAHAALARLREEMSRCGLTLHAEKTGVVDMSQPGGFDFLGYHFEGNEKRPRRKSLVKLKDNVRGLTKRNNGHSLEAIIARLNPILRGWFEYFKHSHGRTFTSLDGWVRMRLRSILRRRHKRRGVGRGWSNIRWPNAFFAKLGLFTMTTARASARQSLQRAH
jgi:RNA-directed DNA polymerase